MDLLNKKEYERFSVSVPIELNEKFENLRNQLNLTRSDAIRKGMRLFINQESFKNLKGTSNLEKNVIGTIAYIERTHTHHHNKEGEHNHTNIKTNEDIGKSEIDVYYRPVEQLEFIQVNDLQHHYLEEIISSNHIHIEIDKCMIIIAVKGKINRILQLVNKLSQFKTIESIQFSPLDTQ